MKEQSTPNSEFEDMVIIGDENFAMGIPYWTPEELISDFVKCFKTYYGESIEKHKILTIAEESKKIFFDLAVVKAEIKDIQSDFGKFKERPNETKGLFHAEAALQRLYPTFQSAILMVNMGRIFEAAALCKLILEQLAWVFFVYKKDDDSVYDIKPSSCITKLKEIIPETGIAYGRYNTFAHMNPEVKDEYIAEYQSQQVVKFNHPNRRKFFVLDLLFLVDSYRIVTELITFEYHPDPKAWDKLEDGNFRLKQNRPLTLIIENTCKNIKGNDELKKIYKLQEKI